MSKDYLGQMIDLTSDAYLNPVPAVYDNGTHIRSEGSIKSISIHHDAGIRPHDYDSVALYKAEAADHYNRLGPGLQYHYKIDNVGQIFKIRPHDTWLYCVGTAENETVLAICLDGNFDVQVPTREQYEALGQLLVNLCEEHPEFPATYPDVRPHRDYSQTDCPGDNLAPWVFAIKSKADVENIPAGATYDWPSEQPGAPAPTPPTPADPTPVPIPAPPTNPDPDHSNPPSTPLPTPEPQPQPTEPTPPTVPAEPAPTQPEAAVDLLLERIFEILAYIFSFGKKGKL